MRNKSSKLIMSKYLLAAVSAHKANDMRAFTASVWAALRYAPIAYAGRIQNVIIALGL